MTKRLMTALAVVVAFAGFSAIGAQEEKKAPDFSLKDTDGKTVALADYKDKTVVLEWTNRECPIVVRHYKDDAMAKRAKAWMEKGVTWIAIDSTNHAKTDDVAKWRTEHGITYPVAMDQSGETGRAYGAQTTPHMFIVKNGVIVYEGAIDNGAKAQNDVVNYVDKALEEIMAGKPVSEAKTKPYGCSVKYGKAVAKKDAAGASHGKWLTNWDEAAKLAKDSKKPILAEFTGSDWCPPCKKLHAEVFGSEEFAKWAEKNVILLQLDYPKKAEQSDELKKQNAELKKKYGITGYPSVLFLDAAGEEVGERMVGYGGAGAESWLKDAEKAMKK